MVCITEEVKHLLKELAIAEVNGLGNDVFHEILDSDYVQLNFMGRRENEMENITYYRVDVLIEPKKNDELCEDIIQSFNVSIKN